MKEENKRYREIIARYLDGNATDIDEEIILNWIENNPDIKDYFFKTKKLWDESNILNRDIDSRVEIAWQQLAERNSVVKRRFINRLTTVASYAAIFILIFGMGWFFLGRRSNSSNNFTSFYREVNDSLKNGYIILADGERFELKERSEHIYLFKNRVVIGNRTIKQSNTEEAALNEIVTSKNQTVSLTLTDTTHVWLNGETKLRFPTFAGNNERKVYLSGEGYFDVTHNEASPFTVKMSDVNVRVLGTSFNISSYPEDNFIETTLVKGVVKVESNGMERNNEGLIIKPGQNASYKKEDGSISHSNVDIELYTSWKDGYLKFRDASFSEVVKKLSHNYELNAVGLSEDAISSRFSGKLILNRDIESILEDIQLIVPFNYEVINDKIIITIKGNENN